METLPIPRQTLTDMVSAWVLAEQEIRQAFATLVQAEARLKAAFNPDSYRFSLTRDSCRYRTYSEPDELMKELKKDAWAAIIDRIELRRCLSIKRAEELNKQLQTGDGLPEITEQQILAMLERLANQVPQFMEEAVREVFEWLTPQHWMAKYKTNSRYEIGHKVILNCIAHSYSSGHPFQVCHYRDSNVRALDNVFHLLDGKGIVKTHYGPLHDAINKSNPDGKFETDYFRGQCYHNGNLHLQFRRSDLLAKLNRHGGGLAIKPDLQAA